MHTARRHLIHFAYSYRMVAPVLSVHECKPHPRIVRVVGHLELGQVGVPEAKRVVERVGLLECRGRCREYRMAKAHITGDEPADVRRRLEFHAIAHVAVKEFQAVTGRILDLEETLYLARCSILRATVLDVATNFFREFTN